MNNGPDKKELPLTDAEREALMDSESGEAHPLNDAEIIIDTNFVHIPLTRYNELVRAEAWLDVIFRVYGNGGTEYFMGHLLRAMKEEGGGNA